ncbi:MAG: FAD binding domain-containing protein [Candidatus Omnitrophota bacterium]
MILKNFNYYRPQTIKEAQELMNSLESPLILAGGTFVLTFFKKSNDFSKNIIGLKNIKELTAIKKEKEYISIGSMVTLDNLCRNDFIKKDFSFLMQVISEVATPQIRNMASIGGNICSGLPWADLAYLMLALDAELVFVDKKIKINEFLDLPKEKKVILKEIKISLNKITRYAFTRIPRLNNTDITQGAVCIIEAGDKVRISANLGNNFARIFKETQSNLNQMLKKDQEKDLINIFSKELNLVQKDEYLREIIVNCFKKSLRIYAKI